MISCFLANIILFTDARYKNIFLVHLVIAMWGSIVEVAYEKTDL